MSRARREDIDDENKIDAQMVHIGSLTRSEPLMCGYIGADGDKPTPNVTKCTILLKFPQKSCVHIIDAQRFKCSQHSVYGLCNNVGCLRVIADYAVRRHLLRETAFFSLWGLGFRLSAIKGKGGSGVKGYRVRENDSVTRSRVGDAAPRQ